MTIADSRASTKAIAIKIVALALIVALAFVFSPGPSIDAQERPPKIQVEVNGEIQAQGDQITSPILTDPGDEIKITINWKAASSRFEDGLIRISSDNLRADIEVETTGSGQPPMHFTGASTTLELADYRIVVSFEDDGKNPLKDYHGITIANLDEEIDLVVPIQSETVQCESARLKITGLRQSLNELREKGDDRGEPLSRALDSVMNDVNDCAQAAEAADGIRNLFDELYARQEEIKSKTSNRDLFRALAIVGFLIIVVAAVAAYFIFSQARSKVSTGPRPRRRF